MYQMSLVGLVASIDTSSVCVPWWKQTRSLYKLWARKETKKQPWCWNAQTFALLVWSIVVRGEERPPEQIRG
jgi:hypothetical protein